MPCERMHWEYLSALALAAVFWAAVISPEGRNALQALRAAWYCGECGFRLLPRVTCSVIDIWPPWAAGSG